MDMEFEIKITGSGTPEEIAKALVELAKTIRTDISNGNDLDGAEYEDQTLMTVINEKQD